MPPETEEQKRRRKEQELELLMELAGQRNLGVAPVPRKNDYTPAGELRFTRNPRAVDAAAVAPMGSVPGPGMSEEEADDQQDEIDRDAFYKQQDLEREREAAAEGDVLEVELAQKQDAPPAAVPPAPPPPITDTYAQHLQKLREQSGASAPLAAPPAAETEKSVSPEVSKGKEADLYGHDAEGGFSRERAIDESGRAYDAETVRRDPINQFDAANAGRTLTGPGGGPPLRGDAVLGLREMQNGRHARSPDEIAELEDKGLITSAPTDAPVRSSVTPDGLPNPYGESESKWEDEFLRNNDRMSNAEIRRKAAIMGAFGSDAEQKAFVDRETGFARDYEKGLAEARARDYGDRRVNRADAVAIGGTGNVDPESAARLTNRDMLMQAYPNGMYGQGLSAERAEKMWQQSNQALLGLQNRQREGIAADSANKDKDIAARFALGEWAARRAEMGTLTPDEQAKLFAAGLTKERGIPKEAGIAAFNGDFSGIPSGLRAEVEAEVDLVKPFRKEAANRPLGPGVRAPEIKLPFDLEKVTQMNVAKARSDLKYADKMQTDIGDTALQLRQGMEAWEQMSEQGKRAFATYGAKGLGEVVARGLTNAHDRARAGAVWTVLNNLIQERSGVAVTESEWGRTAKEIGLGSGTWDPFNSYEGIERYLNNAAERMQARYETYSRLIGWK